MLNSSRNTLTDIAIITFDQMSGTMSQSSYTWNLPSQWRKMKIFSNFMIKIQTDIHTHTTAPSYFQPNTQAKQLKGVKIYFGSEFQRFQSIKSLVPCFWPVMRQYIKWKVWWKKSVHLIAARKQKGAAIGKARAKQSPHNMLPVITSSKLALLCNVSIPSQ
jgi:hypothetical protein